MLTGYGVHQTVCVDRPYGSMSAMPSTIVQWMRPYSYLGRLVPLPSQFRWCTAVATSRHLVGLWNDNFHYNQGGLVGTGSKGYTKREPCLAGRLANSTPRDRQGTASTSSILPRCSGLYSYCTSRSFARQTIYTTGATIDGIGPWVGNRARDTPNRSKRPS